MFKFICLIFTSFAVISLVVLIWHILRDGYEWLRPELFTEFQSRFPRKAGIKAGVFGTIWLISLTAFFSIPLGIASGIYLEEYGKKGKIGKIIEVNVTNLAGVPSIVYGLLGLALFVRLLDFGGSVLSGALTLSLLIMPIIIVTTREAIKAVPHSIKYAAYSLGARKYQVVFGHVLPTAMPGIVTGIILALARAIGETAPLIIVGALAYVTFIPESPMDEFTVMPLQIYNWASRPQEDFHKLAASSIVVLLTITFFMNFVAVLIRSRGQKRMKL